LIGLALALALPLGCRSTPAEVEQADGIVATYSGTELTCDLPESARVPAVIAAADQTLRARGYTIVQSTSTEDAGEIIGRPPRYNNYPRLVVKATGTATGSRVVLEYEPFGNQEVSRSVLDSMLSRLGF